MQLELGTPLAQRVQDAVQQILVAYDMSSQDDMVMSEYVTVMIANHKGREAITEELGELVGGDLEPRIPQEIWDAASAVCEKEQGDRQERRRSASPDSRPGPRAVDRREDVSHDTSRRERRADRNQRSAPRNTLQNHLNASQRDRNRGASRELLPEKPRSKMHSDQIQEPVSIFGRAGVPDPHATPFVPPNSIPPMPQEFPAMMAAMAGGPSLFARLDPMMPNNPTPSVQQATDAVYNMSRDPSTFPSAPSESALCRYSIHCTNPQCIYSHPSPANAGKHGNESALVLRQDACPAGARCEDKECVLSHVSPAVALLPKKSNNPTSESAVPCKFQEQCLNPACHFLHFDSHGQPIPAPASRSVPCRFGTRCTRPDCHYLHPNKSKTPCRYGDQCTRPDCLFTHPRDAPINPTADRLKPFAEQSQEIERILPGQTDSAKVAQGSA
ncbi:mRNA-binding protein nab2 [Malassezia psittaci]|uniref:mRNA-binding protein nab2 n=1 Tax=Malassezia psittaci TaxID=1821823 RepID=A0AAF0JLL8_9BASI|nr:mRNA-binding protein nab2 [Malassezia psittaci]